MKLLSRTDRKKYLIVGLLDVIPFSTIVILYVTGILGRINFQSIFDWLFPMIILGVLFIIRLLVSGISMIAYSILGYDDEGPACP